MWTQEWFSIIGTLLLILIQACGSARQHRSRNTQGASARSFQETRPSDDDFLVVTQQNVASYGGQQRARDFAIPKYRSEHGVKRQSRGAHHTPQQRAASSFPGNYPQPAVDARRYVDPDNSLHKLYGAGKLAGGVGGVTSTTPENIGRSSDGGGGGRRREDECCVRRPYVVSVGYDAFGKKMLVDVGRCRRIVKSVVAHLALLGSNPEQRLELLERIANSQTQYPTCGSSDSCSARQSRLDRINLRGGLKEVAVIEECACTPKPSQCQRMSEFQTLFPNSPYETSLDVGMCLGHCKSQDGTETQCRPTKTRTVSVEGPMGAHCVDVIESCECTSECYRTSFIEAFYASEWNATLNQTQQVVKKIDVGRCAGGCQSSRSVKCLMGSGQHPGTCLMGLYGQTSCSPRSYTSHEFFQRDRERIAVLSIDACQCQ